MVGFNTLYNKYIRCIITNTSGETLFESENIYIQFIQESNEWFYLNDLKNVYNHIDDSPSSAPVIKLRNNNKLDYDQLINDYFNGTGAIVNSAIQFIGDQAQYWSSGYSKREFTGGPES